MSFTNFQKTIALTGGVLVLSVAVGYIVIAAPWQGPTANPPGDNADAPINVGSDPQTKAGNLTVSELTASGGRIYLNNSGFEGDIERVNQIIGENDLQLRDSVNKTKIDLDVWDTGKIEFYTNGQERMRIEEGGDLHKQGDLYVENGDLHVPDLTDVPDFDGCFLEIDENGKIKCYTGGGIPGGNLLETTQVLVAFASYSSGSGCNTGVNPCCDSYTILAGGGEKVIRFYGNLSYSAAHPPYFDFYINGVKKWSRGNMTYVGSKYYHVIEGDVLKVCVKGSIASGRIYTLGAKRELITHAFADEAKILYWYDQAVTGEMSPGGAHYIGGNPPTSVIISAKDSIHVKWILD